MVRIIAQGQFDVNEENNEGILRVSFRVGRGGPSLLDGWIGFSEGEAVW